MQNISASSSDGMIECKNTTISSHFMLTDGKIAVVSFSLPVNLASEKMVFSFRPLHARTLFNLRKIDV